MKTILTLIAIVCILAACKKDNPTPPSPPGTVDSTDTTTNSGPVKDTTLKIVGIDSVVILGIYDSIVIPFTIMREGGSVDIVDLEMSDLPMRMKGKFTHSTGATPFACSLKLNTYLFADAYSADTIVITATAGNGQQVRYKFSFKIDYLKQDHNKAFYEAIKKNPIIHTYDQAKNKVWSGTTFNFDAATGSLYMTGVYLGQIAGKTYVTLDDFLNPFNNIMVEMTMISQGHFDFKSYNDIKGVSGNDTAEFDLFAPSGSYYIFDEINPSFNNDSVFMFGYKVVGGQHFSCVGSLTFD